MTFKRNASDHDVISTAPTQHFDGVVCSLIHTNVRPSFIWINVQLYKMNLNFNTIGKKEGKEEYKVKTNKRKTSDKPLTK